MSALQEAYDEIKAYRDRLPHTSMCCRQSLHTALQIIEQTQQRQIEQERQRSLREIKP